MLSVFVASQSSCFFLCSRQQIRLVENRLYAISELTSWKKRNCNLSLTCPTFLLCWRRMFGNLPPGKFSIKRYWFIYYVFILSLFRICLYTFELITHSIHIYYYLFQEVYAIIWVCLPPPGDCVIIWVFIV